MEIRPAGCNTSGALTFGALTFGALTAGALLAESRSPAVVLRQSLVRRSHVRGS